MLSGCVSGENEPSGLIDPCPTPEEGTKESTEYFSHRTAADADTITCFMFCLFNIIIT